MPRAPSLALLRSQSDDRLVRLARQGHERAFEAIVERYRKPLHRECRRVLPEARAEDAVQQAFLAAWTALRRGDEVRELRPWLHRIGHNTALNVARAPGFDYDELRDSLRLTEAPQDELERRAVIRQTLAGIAALPERQREALLRTAIEGTSQEQIARELGLSNGAVRQLVHRARMSLRAAVTAVTPLPFAAWLAAAGARSDPMTQRIVELAAGGAGVGAAATAAKVGAAVVVAGGAITGPVALDGNGTGPRASQPRERTVTEQRAERHRAPARAAVTPPLASAASPQRDAAAPQGEAPRAPASGSGDEDERGDHEDERGDREDEREGRGEPGERDEREHEDEDEGDRDDEERGGGEAERPDDGEQEEAEREQEHDAEEGDEQAPLQRSEPAEAREEEHDDDDVAVPVESPAGDDAEEPEESEEHESDSDSDD